jgi:hypothetical protein
LQRFLRFESIEEGLLEKQASEGIRRAESRKQQSGEGEGEGDRFTTDGERERERGAEGKALT